MQIFSKKIHKSKKFLNFVENVTFKMQKIAWGVDFLTSVGV